MEETKIKQIIKEGMILAVIGIVNVAVDKAFEKEVKS